MTHIRVNPESVQAYGRAAQAQFEQMHQSLVDLVNDVVNVQYFGPNAVAFKTECGQIAATFASALWDASAEAVGTVAGPAQPPATTHNQPPDETVQSVAAADGEF